MSAVALFMAGCATSPFSKESVIDVPWPEIEVGGMPAEVPVGATASGSYDPSGPVRIPTRSFLYDYDTPYSGYGAYGYFFFRSVLMMRSAPAT